MLFFFFGLPQVVHTRTERKVLEAVGGGAELDELRGILEEDAGG